MEPYHEPDWHIAVLIGTLLIILLAWRMRPSLPLAVLVATLVSYHGLIHDAAILAVPLGMVLVQSVSENNLLLGTLGLLVFACPLILFQFFNGLFFPMAFFIVALLFLLRSVPQGEPLSSRDQHGLAPV